MDVKGYSYFIERRDSDKLWVATVEEFPALQAESKFRNRALNELQDAVAATITRLHRAGERFPAPPAVAPSAVGDFLTTLGFR